MLLITQAYGEGIAGGVAAVKSKNSVIILFCALFCCGVCFLQRNFSAV